MTRGPTAGAPMMPSESTEGLDWDALRAAIDTQGGIRNTRMMGELPLHPPIRLLRSVADGIEPLRHYESARELSDGPQYDTPLYGG